MKKRPLSMAVLIVMMILWLLPAKIWMKEPIFAGGGSAVSQAMLDAGLQGKAVPEFLTGEVWKLEESSSGQAVYLKHTNFYTTGNILVYLDAGQDLAIGNILKIKQPYELQEPAPAANPGQFDARLYYQTQKVWLFCFAKDAEIVDCRVNDVGQLLYELRQRLKVQCDQLFSPKESGVVKAMLLGDKKDLDADVKHIYQTSGMSHLLSISGLHVSLIGMSLYRLLRRMGCTYPAAGVPAMIFMFLYGNLTGMSTSTARAVTMFVLAVVADVFGKNYDMLTALAVAALLLLAEQPLYARSASFLLSFGAVLGIGFLYPAVLDLYGGGLDAAHNGRPAICKCQQTTLLSISLQILTLPLIQYFYYEIPLYSILVNFIAIPLMSILMPAGICALLVSFVSVQGAWLPACICKGILFLYEWLGEQSLRLPGAVFVCGQPKIWQMILYYAGIAAFVWWRYRIHEQEKWKTDEELEAEKEDKKIRNIKEKLRRRSRLACMGGFLIFFLLLSWRFHPGFTFAMLDVGQGDGLFFRTAAGTTCLMDGGSTDVKQVGTYRMVPFLKSQGVRKLDYIFVSHTDADHISGILELLEMAGEPGSVKIQNLVMSEQDMDEDAGNVLKELAEKRGVKMQVFQQGMILKDDSTDIVCLHPAVGAAYDDKNASSLVLQVSYGDFSMLLTGDLEAEGEQEILRNLAGSKEKCLECDILKVGHHGSANSTSQEWLDEVHPAVALISCGENNSYGHPHGETLERLKDIEAAVFATPECGAIIVRSDGEEFTIEKFKKN